MSCQCKCKDTCIGGIFLCRFSWYITHKMMRVKMIKFVENALTFSEKTCNVYNCMNKTLLTSDTVSADWVYPGGSAYNPGC